MKINSTLFQIPVVKNVIYFEETDSTNKKAKEFGEKGCVDGTLIIANSQTFGKGRLGRNFSSPPGDGIYMSLLLRPDFSPEYFSYISIIASIAVTRTIKNISCVLPLIKWPNDILVNEKKLVGILCESRLCADDSFVVLGIGINVNNKSFSNELSEHATSLFLERNIVFSREELIYGILHEFSELYEILLKEKDLGFIVDEYNKHLICRNKDIYIIPQNISNNSPSAYLASTTGLKTNRCLGIDNTGNLLCIDSSGQTICLNSGEVSIRGLNGYIA